jgi:hypothetical protein
MKWSRLGKEGKCICGRELIVYSGDYEWWGCPVCRSLDYDCVCKQDNRSVKE